jgi:hypothetical protein
MPSVVDQDINVTDVLGKVFDVGWVAQVRGDKPSLPAGRLNLFDDRCATRRVATNDDDLHAVTSEPHGDFFAEAGSCSRHECGRGLVVERGHGFNQLP